MTTSRSRSSEEGKSKKKDDDAMDVDDEETSKKEEESGNAEEEEEEEEDEEDDYQYKWLDKGRRRHQRVEYDSVLLTLHETSFRVSKNDFVLLWGIHGDDPENKDEADGADQTIEEIWQSAGCAKVEAMWEEPAEEEEGRPKAMFQARWFFQKNDLNRVLKKEDLMGSISLDSLKKRMRPREVVGSLEVGTYVMNTIGGPARVFFRSVPNEEEQSENKEDDDEEPQLPKDAFMCRYSLKKADKDDASEDAEKEKVTMEVVPYAPEDDTEEEEGDDDDDDDEESKGRSRKRARGSDKDNDTVDEDDTSGGSSSDDESRTQEGEGSITNQGKIRVGPQHQVPVPPHDPKTKIISRNPTLVWSKETTTTQEQLDEYFNKAGAILTPFAEKQLLVMGTEPFTSIPSADLEAIMREREGNAALTVSSISTSASLSSSALKTNLIRECDADALLKNLHDHKYSVEAALGMVAASPRDFLTKWTLQERESYDNAFREHGGSLRMVAKSMSSLASDKTHCQVVDYHYRFKIPDQYRRYQDKKREQAVRMMECIEARRHHDSSEVHIVPQGSKPSGDENTSSAGENPKKKKAKTESWSDTSTGDVTKAVEERRSAAKQLLLDIQRDMGKDKMAEVAGAVISLNQGSERDSKEALLRILKNHPALHQRLVEFLPRRFWK